MRNFTKTLAVAVVAVLGFSANSFGQVTGSADASATIVTPISILKTVDLHFGNVAVSPTLLGTVVLAPAGGRTATGGVTLPVTASGSPTAASFTISGEANYTYAITLPSTATSITRSGGGSMNVNAFTSSPTPTGTLSALGAQTLTVGATLNVAAAQTAGLYESATAFDVIVNYN